MSELMEMFFGKTIEQGYILNYSNLMVSLIYTLFVGMFMLLVYRSIHNSLEYNKKFAVTLMMLAFISTILLALVENNPLLSLGVLGSLSICRIRTNTKDPRDIGFVFWALSIGIASAVGAFAMGVIAAVLLGSYLYLSYNLRKKSDSLLMIIRGEKAKLATVQEYLHRAARATVQSKNVFQDTFELVYELDIRESDEEQLLASISEMDGIKGVNILAPETKVVG